ncbi:hypothetical protein TSUD_14420 [Trifolium subterraneum]|uniref:Uncharacterized protein n=1 Tax=Trifolium subterraneum TaxID=3900 RepID=A0A2Z6P851_TRISU|nr:hypothetical protein TSUD_14420 [Trifolium subterraneum]
MPNTAWSGVLCISTSSGHMPIHLILGVTSNFFLAVKQLPLGQCDALTYELLNQPQDIVWLHIEWRQRGGLEEATTAGSRLGLARFANSLVHRYSISYMSEDPQLPLGQCDALTYELLNQPQDIVWLCIEWRQRGGLEKATTASSRTTLNNLRTVAGRP